MSKELSNEDEIFYEVTFPDIGRKIWHRELPEWIETPTGTIHRSTLVEFARTRVWERTLTGWVLSSRHA